MRPTRNEDLLMAFVAMLILVVGIIYLTGHPREQNQDQNCECVCN